MLPLDPGNVVLEAALFEGVFEVDSEELVEPLPPTILSTEESSTFVALLPTRSARPY